MGANSEAVHFVDAMWCDVEGVYVRGWAHAGTTPLKGLRLQSGDSRIKITERFDRPDVRPHYPHLHSDLCGFSAYLACLPFRPVTLVLETVLGEVAADLQPPPHMIPGKEASPRPLMPRFVAEMRSQGGVVVEIGARAVSAARVDYAGVFGANCRYVGVDVHAASGVDVVADAHFLSDSFSPGSVSGVFSEAVMEHVAVPWLVAAETNRVLRIGGLIMHLVPQTFPVHEQPNDFWRMTDAALRVLYGPATGFDVLEAGMSDPVRIYYSAQRRFGPYLDMPFARGMGSAFILARKVSDICEDAVRWPFERASLLAQGQSYPVRAAPGQAPDRV